MTIDGRETLEYQDNWLSKGIESLIAKNFEEAIRCFNEAIQLDPDNFYAWYNKAHAYGMLRNYKEVIDCLDEAIRINPSYSKSWVNKGVSFRFIGKFDEAISCFNQKPHPKGWGMLRAALPRTPGFSEFRNRLIFVAPVPLIYKIEALLSVFPEIP